ncbi:MAG: transferrin-binding protein-like solute binding protein [Boseongicola sp. SB0662_bin_57]|nr:transferrin-binding protein-like solute binding protein [Boseongicola sp. SB0662_bin_57]
MSVAVLAGAMVLSGCKGGGGSSPALPPPLEPPPQAETPAPSGPEPATPVQQPQPEPDPDPAPQPQTQPSSPAPTPPPSQHTGHPSLQNLQNIQNMPNWWHRRQSFEDLLAQITADGTPWTVLQAYGDFTFDNPITVDGVKATYTTSRRLAPGDSHGYVTRLPTLDDDIRLTEDAGAILFIPIARHHDLADANGKKDETTYFGGWMDHSFFFVTNEAGGVDRAGGRPETLLTEAYAMGDLGTSRPTSGRASWLGAMVGVVHDKSSDRYGRAVVGKSYLNISDFTDVNSLSVHLINMVDTVEGRSWPDISWENVPVRSDGRFVTHGIQGSFYGPGGEDAAGVFVKGGLGGAFGASRSIGTAPSD